jgi:serine/threonine protein kinase
MAHMDLKPQKILIPRNGSRLSTIDFNTSLRVKGIEQRVRGIVGTTGYTAPEVVRDDLYSAIRADLYMVLWKDVRGAVSPVLPIH